jgi:probable HAF family extracellular repeat protein
MKGVFMNSRRFIFGRALSILITLVALFPAVGWAEGYTAVDLGTLGGGFSIANAVNNRGEVVGRSAIPNGPQHAFIWQDGVMTDLGTLPGGNYSEAFAINNRRQVVGWGTVNESTCTGFDGCWHGFLWENGAITDLGTLGAGFMSYAYSINDHGDIVGISTRADHPFDEWHAVRWSDGVMTDLGTVPAARQTFSFGINHAGAVVGSFTDAAGHTFPLLWNRDRITALPTLAGATYTEPYKISNRGDAVGVSNDHAVLWSRGGVTDLGLPSGAVWTFGRDLNNSGVVVGDSFIPSSGNRAFVWADGVIRALPGGVESFAKGVNARGDIAGAIDSGNGLHAVIWTQR